VADKHLQSLVCYLTSPRRCGTCHQLMPGEIDDSYSGTMNPGECINGSDSLLRAQLLTTTNSPGPAILISDHMLT